MGGDGVGGWGGESARAIVCVVCVFFDTVFSDTEFSELAQMGRRSSRRKIQKRTSLTLQTALSLHELPQLDL